VALRFTDPLVLARPVRAGADQSTLAYLVERIEAAATAHDVAYLKILADQVIAAADPAADPALGAAQLAEFALAVQSECDRLFAEQHAPLAFRLGMDLGPALADRLGRAGRTFNLWGEAIRMAERLADSGQPGAIHASESVYQALYGRYLLQLRGRHYLEGVGEFSTYLLSGRP
jgi:adenylate cyclase